MLLRRLLVTSFAACRKYSAATLSKTDVEAKTLDVLRAFNKVNQKNINLDAKFSTDLGLDSLDVVEVIMALEDEFVVEIPDVEADKFMTPRDAVLFIHQKLSG